MPSDGTKTNHFTGTREVRIGKPKRDRSKNKSARHARKKNR